MELHLGDEDFLQNSSSGVISPAPHLALSSSCGILQARTLEWGAIAFSVSLDTWNLILFNNLLPDLI